MAGHDPDVPSVHFEDLDASVRDGFLIEDLDGPTGTEQIEEWREAATLVDLSRFRTDEVGPDDTAMTYRFAETVLEERDRLLKLAAFAYDAMAQSVESMTNPEHEGEYDLPIGAALWLPGQKIISQGYAVDRQTGDPAAHAEVMAIRSAEEVTGDTKGASLFSTVEPCPNCMHAIDEAGIALVGYALSRKDLEDLGIVKPHDQDAHDLHEYGAEDGRMNFRLVQISTTPIRAAFLEPFHAVYRSGEAVFADEETLRTTRVASYLRAINLFDKTTAGSETARILDRFQAVQEQFYR